MKISLVIPTQGNFKRVQRLLKSIEKQTDCGPVETIVLCNPPNHQLNSLKNQFTSINLKVIQSVIIGVNHARQLGLEQTCNDLVCFFDDDCVLSDPQTLFKLLQNHISEPELFATGGFYDFKSDQPTSVQKLYFNIQNRWVQEGLIDLKTQACAYLFGGFFAVKKQLLRQHHLQFDVSMIFGGTEKEFFLQAYHKKLKMKLLPLKVEHHYNDSFFGYLKKVFKQGRGQKYIECKNIFFESKYALGQTLQTSWQSYILESAYWLGYYSFDHQFVAFVKNRLRHAFETISLGKVVLLNRIKKDL